MVVLRLVLPILLMTLGSIRPTIGAADEKPEDPCTVHSVNTGAYYDLNKLSAHALKDGETKSKSDLVDDWTARGYDFGANFTINVCAPVVHSLEEVVGINKSLYKNVSAYYTRDDLVYSIGQVSTGLHFRGRKLVLQYTDGSPCATSSKGRYDSVDDGKGKQARSHDDDGDDETTTTSLSSSTKTSTKTSAKTTSAHKPTATATAKPAPRRKSTTISFLCDRDPDSPKAAFSFVGTDPDHCAFFFESRTAAACGGHSRDKEQGVGAGGVFGIIALITLIVYVVGGCVYQRTVMHQRGWRQLPNYSLWAGIAGFTQDLFIIIGSMLGRCVPGGNRRKGYSNLSISADDRRSSARQREDDENRLIDQMDDHWDD